MSTFPLNNTVHSLLKGPPQKWAVDAHTNNPIIFPIFLCIENIKYLCDGDYREVFFVLFWMEFGVDWNLCLLF